MFIPANEAPDVMLKTLVGLDAPKPNDIKRDMVYICFPRPLETPYRGVGRHDDEGKLLSALNSSPIPNIYGGHRTEGWFVISGFGGRSVYYFIHKKFLTLLFDKLL